MKKLNIMMLGVLGMFAASCDEAPEAPKPQENPQGPILTQGDVTSAAAGVLASTEVLNLEDYRTAVGVPVMQLVETKSLPENASIGYTVELADNEEFTGKVMTLDTRIGADSVYTVDALDWNAAHVALFGKSPKVKTAYYRVPVYVNVNGSNYRYIANDYYAATGSIQETCMDQGFVIETGYYLIGNLTDWAINAEYPFEHSEKDVYDDPVFELNFKVTEDLAASGCYWKIAPQSSVDGNSWDGVLGTETDGDTSLSGKLTDANPQAGKIAEAGNYKMTINMEEMTYVIEKLLRPEYLYTPGGTNGWSQANSAWMQYDNKNETSKGYYGLFPVNDQGFKVCLELTWNDATNYGAESEDPADAGKFLLGGGGKNIHPAGQGMYWMSAQYDETLGQLTTYAMTPITRIGVIGSFEASGWGSDIEMTANADQTVWTAEVALAADNEWKIRFNNDWVYSLGADPKNADHAVLDGDNYKATETGTYVITLTVQPGIPTITCVKK